MQARQYEENIGGYTSPPAAGSSGEYYGFALYIVITVVMVLWVLWALVPDQLLHKVGIDWYPNR
jgi:hypothetical protein